MRKPGSGKNRQCTNMCIYLFVIDLLVACAMVAVLANQLH